MGNPGTDGNLNILNINKFHIIWWLTLTTKEVHIDFIQFSCWPRVIDPDPGSFKVCQMVLGETCKRPCLRIKFWHGVFSELLSRLHCTCRKHVIKYRVRLLLCLGSPLDWFYFFQWSPLQTMMQNTNVCTGIHSWIINIPKSVRNETIGITFARHQIYFSTLCIIFS